MPVVCETVLVDSATDSCITAGVFATIEGWISCCFKHVFFSTADCACIFSFLRCMNVLLIAAARAFAASMGSKGLVCALFLSSNMAAARLLASATIVSAKLRVCLLSSFLLLATIFFFAGSSAPGLCLVCTSHRRRFFYKQTKIGRW